MGVSDAVQVDAAAGLIVVGHKQGEARVYQFSQEEQDGVCVELDGKRPAEHVPRRQPAGFQCILQCSHHAATTSSIAIASHLKLVALADESGHVSLLDLGKVNQLDPLCSAVTLPPGSPVLPLPPAQSLLPWQTGHGKK